jgi:riboflavin kinase/FMN adenylyltransferase
MLGRPFSILGTVEQGDARGRELGFPTANLDPHNQVLPPDGVYAVRARLFEQGKFSATNARLLHGVLNLGLRPTFQSPHPKRVLEVHLFGFAENLYGKDIEVIFGPKIRNEQKFESVDALRQQIAADCAAARAILSATNK